MNETPPFNSAEPAGSPFPFPLSHALTMTRACTRALAGADSEEQAVGGLRAALAEHGGYAAIWYGALNGSVLNGSGRGWGGMATDQSHPALSAEQPLVVTDIAAAGDDVDWRHAALRAKFGSAFAVAIRGGGARLGALEVFATEPGRFNESECAVLYAIAEELGETLAAFAQPPATEERVSDALIASLPGTYFLLDRHGRLLRWNRNLERISGYSTGELATMHALDFFDKDEQRNIASAIEIGFRDGWVQVEAEMRTRTGRCVPFLFSAVVTRLDGRDCMTGIGLDIGERVRLEEARYRLSEIVAAAPDVVVTFDPGGKLLDANPCALRRLGLNAAVEARGVTLDTLLDVGTWSRLRHEGIPHAVRYGSWDGEGTLCDDGEGEVEVSLVVVAHADHRGKVRYLSTIARDIGALRRAEQERRLAASVYETADEGMLITDADKRIVSVNPAFSRLTGYSPEESLHRDPGELLRSGRHDRAFYASMYRRLRDHGHWHGEIQNRYKDGSVHTLQQTISEVHDDRGRVVHYVATFADISALREAQREACEQRDFVDALLNSIPGLFFFVDRQGMVRRANYDAVRFTGNERLADGGPLELVQLVAAEQGKRLSLAMEHGFRSGQMVRLELDIIGADRQPCPYLLTAVPVCFNGVHYLCAIGVDIAQRKQLERRLKTMATTDPLTGANNRLPFQEHLERAIERVERYGRPFSVAMLDIDHFKRINDHFGHEVGDRVLRQLVREVGSQLRTVDVLCRWGGEEFLLLAPETDTQGIGHLAERVRRRVEACRFDGCGRLTISIGAAECTKGESTRAFLKRVDDALYQAKSGGRNRVVVAP